MPKGYIRRNTKHEVVSTASVKQAGPCMAQVEPLASAPSLETSSNGHASSLLQPSKIVKELTAESEFKYQPLSFGGIPMRVDNIPVESYGLTFNRSPLITWRERRGNKLPTFVAIFVVGSGQDLLMDFLATNCHTGSRVKWHSTLVQPRNFRRVDEQDTRNINKKSRSQKT